MHDIYISEESHGDFCTDFLSIISFGMDPKKLLFSAFLGFVFYPGIFRVNLKRLFPGVPDNSERG